MPDTFYKSPFFYYVT